MKKTILSSEHEKLGARMVDFAGWWMPVQYKKGLIAEHNAVRENVGLFDVSHMGEIFVSGPSALATLQWLTSNDVAKLNNGDAQYSLLMNFEGGIVDDIIIYCLKKNERYLVCVNASNTDKDYAWMKEHNKGAQIENESAQWSQIAIQGPKAMELVKLILGSKACEPKYFQFVTLTEGDYAGSIVARTGYTGEDGVEVFLPNKLAIKLWKDLYEEGGEPIGLGARDTLRTEMKYSLYGHEITDATNALEAGLGWVVKLAKGDFIGRSVLEKTKAEGVKNKLVGFKLIDKGIPRAEMNIVDASGVTIGKVTSGTMSPLLMEPIGIGYVPTALSLEGSEIFVDIRGRKAKAQVVKTPFKN